MADKMRDREVGYVPKANANRNPETIKAPESAAKLEADQTARRPDLPRGPDPECDEEPGKNRGGRYGDGW